MRIYIVSFEEYEDMLEAVFDENEVMLDSWSPNDAYWSDNFNNFLSPLGIEVARPSKAVMERLQEKMKQYCEAQGWLD